MYENHKMQSVHECVSKRETLSMLVAMEEETTTAATLHLGDPKLLPSSLINMFISPC